MIAAAAFVEASVARKLSSVVDSDAGSFLHRFLGEGGQASTPAISLHEAHVKEGRGRRRIVEVEGGMSLDRFMR